MLSQLSDQNVLLRISPVEFDLEFLCQCRKTLPVLNHRVYRRVLQLLGRLQLRAIFGQDLDTLLAVFVVEIGPVD